MKKVAIVGVGPTGIYTFHALVKRGEPLEIELYEQARETGVSIPYNSDNNADHVLANVASIEIPPIYISYLTWLQNQSSDYLTQFQIERTSLHEWQFLPRVILGGHYHGRFSAIVDKAQQTGFTAHVHEASRAADLQATPNEVSVQANCSSQPVGVGFAVIATGHLWLETDAQACKFFPSPWTDLMDAQTGACRVGILGISLSTIDAAMAMVNRHGTLTTNTDHSLQFAPRSDN